MLIDRGQWPCGVPAYMFIFLFLYFVMQAIAGLIYNTPLLLSVLDKLQFPNTNETVTAQFFSRWVSDFDCFFG